MNNKEIIDNAPESATHWDGDGYVVISKNKNNYFSHKRSKWATVYELVLEPETRSLADIRRIVELENHIQSLLVPSPRTWDGG